MILLLILTVIYLCSVAICKLYLCYHVIVEQGTWRELFILILVSVSPVINTVLAVMILIDLSQLITEWFMDLDFWHKPVWKGKKPFKKDA